MGKISLTNLNENEVFHRKIGDIRFGIFGENDGHSKKFAWLIQQILPCLQKSGWVSPPDNFNHFRPLPKSRGQSEILSFSAFLVGYGAKKVNIQKFVLATNFAIAKFWNQQNLKDDRDMIWKPRWITFLKQKVSKERIENILIAEFDKINFFSWQNL